MSLSRKALSQSTNAESILELTMPRCERLSRYKNVNQTFFFVKISLQRVHAAGGKITYFTSFAGGLPAPECDDNPFRYKFSWSPKGVLLAGKNSASFYRDGKEVFIQGSELFKSFWQFGVEGFEDFECYPNRDSKPYRDIYGIPECKTVIRGTLRNQGWCEKIKKLVDLGYVDETPSSVGGLS